MLARVCLCLFCLYTPLAIGQTWALNAGYNKSNISQSGGGYVQASGISRNGFKWIAGFEQLGTLQYTEDFGTISYAMNQLYIGTGYQINTMFDPIKLHINTSASIPLITIQLSNPQEGVDGDIVKAFYPAVHGSFETQFFITHALSFFAGLHIQSPYLLSNNPLQTSWNTGLSYSWGNNSSFKEDSAFTQQVNSTLILKRIETCYLCRSTFYSLLIGTFQNKQDLRNALNNNKLNLLFTTKYYLSNPQSVFYTSTNGVYSLYFGEFKSSKRSNTWKKILTEHYKIHVNIKSVSLFDSNNQHKLLPIKSIFQ